MTSSSPKGLLLFSSLSSFVFPSCSLFLFSCSHLQSPLTFRLRSTRICFTFFHFSFSFLSFSSYRLVEYAKEHLAQIEQPRVSVLRSDQLRNKLSRKRLRNKRKRKRLQETNFSRKKKSSFQCTFFVSKCDERRVSTSVCQHPISHGGP